MITRLDRGTDLLRNQNGSHRQASRQRLGESQHVRHYSCVLVSEKVARAAEARLDFIENESDLAFRRQLAKPLQEFRVQDADSALSLNRLDDHRCDCLLIECGLEICEIPLTD